MYQTVSSCLNACANLPALQFLALMFPAEIIFMSKSLTKHTKQTVLAPFLILTSCFDCDLRNCGLEECI